MKRKIIEIDEKLCNGCGNCIPNCPEGAIRMIDGKARLVSDLFCDGLGACLGECPQGAITMTEREAAPYDERLVMERIAAQGVNTVRAHLHHLRSHGEQELHRIAVEYLREKGIPVPEEAAEETLGRGCRYSGEGADAAEAGRRRSAGGDAVGSAAVAGTAPAAESGGSVFRRSRSAGVGGLRALRDGRLPPRAAGWKDSDHLLSEAR